MTPDPAELAKQLFPDRGGEADGHWETAGDDLSWVADEHG